MPLRLLDKPDIQKQKAQERAREIEEGMKISRKVDALRETKAKEEHTLELFRKATLEEIGKEIGLLNAQKEDLKIEVAYLKEEIAKETPFTRQERLNLQDLKKVLDKKEKQLDERDKSLSLLEIDLAIASKNCADIAKKNADTEKTIHNLEIEAQKDRFEAKSVLKQAKNREERVVKLEMEADSRLSLRESDISAREKDIFTREQEIQRISSEQEEERKRIADQWAQLNKTAERLRENRL